MTLEYLQCKTRGEEMKKDKEWLKDELVQSYLKENVVYLDGKEFQKVRYFEISEKKLFNLIDQIDEPEVKQIKELESYNDELIRDNNQLISALDELEVLSQDLPVIPKFVADWMEENSTGRCAWWKKIAEWEDEVPAKDRKVYDWYTQSNEDTFILAWITRHYEVEEEPLYYVLDKNEVPFLIKLVSNSYVRRANTYYTIKETNDSKFYQLTEQEIKDYDERFWAFAVPVEDEEDGR